MKNIVKVLAGLFLACLPAHAHSNLAPATFSTVITDSQTRIRADQYCSTPGVLNASCIANALAANRTIIVPAGTYSISSRIDITQSHVTIQCKPHAILRAANATMPGLISFTGSGDSMTGCTIDDDNTPISLGGSSYTVSFNGAANFTFTGDTIQNSQNYSLIGGGANGAEVSGNTILQPPNTATHDPIVVFYSSAQNYHVHNNTVNGSLNLYTTTSGDVAAGNTFSNNTINIVGNGTISSTLDFCMTVQSNAPGLTTISHFAIIGNTCNITGTTNSVKAYGGFSVAIDTSSGTITQNTINANNQYLDIAGIESGCAECTITGNTLNLLDAGSTQASGILHYAGQTLISNNNVNGWGNGNDAFGIRLYPQAGGDNNIISGNILVNTTQAAGDNRNYGIGVTCNIKSQSSRNENIIGNFVSVGANGRGIEMQDATSGSCPTSGVIDKNIIVGNRSAYGVYLHYTTATIGANSTTGVTTPFLNSGISVTIRSLQ